MHGFSKTALRLIDHQVNIRAKDKKGQTPLHKAALEGRFEMIELLIEAGRNKFGDAYVREV
jgi:ankyrin repeat protein